MEETSVVACLAQPGLVPPGKKKAGWLREIFTLHHCGVGRSSPDLQHEGKCVRHITEIGGSVHEVNDSGDRAAARTGM